MRVVLDTNVFVSGIHWTGNYCSMIIKDWIETKFDLIISISIIEEITETLKNFKIPLAMEDILMWENMIVKNSLLVEPQEKIEIVKDDKDDNKFIEAAVEGKADYIITQDNHLLKIKEFRGIMIISPEEFLKVI